METLRTPEMPPRTNAIYRKAAIWAARAGGEDFSAEQRAALDAWLAKDARHLGAYIQSCAAFERIERLRTALRDDQRLKELTPSNRLD
jgi:ferric-dicitrate binding protein FerR (iron transport regulator)